MYFVWDTPRRVSWAGQGRVSLPWESKALDGLEIPAVVGDLIHRLNFNFFFKFRFEVRKLLRNRALAGLNETKRAVYDD